MNTTRQFIVIALIALSSCLNRPTDPLVLTNQEASLPVGLPYNPLEWRIITSTIDQQKGTMSTLFGNDIAVHHRRSSSDRAYPPGSVLSLVTWLQQNDKHWFGARIPARIESIEFIKVDSTPDNRSSYSYEHYDVMSGKKLSVEGSSITNTRIESVLGQRASVMP
jgi:hypothetical protein